MREVGRREGGEREGCVGSVKVERKGRWRRECGEGGSEEMGEKGG